MMAAVTPRLRPLLRALRAQELRAPLWARGHNGRRCLGTKAAAVTPTSPMEQQSPVVGQEKTLMGQQTPLMGQESPLMGQDSLMGQQSSVMGQERQLLEGQAPLVGQQEPVGPLVGQPHGCVGLEEPRLEDLGLGALSPVGFVQNLLQFLHLDLGLPWWGAIAAGTLGVRLALLPLLLHAQREAARIAPHLPHIQRLAKELQEARRGAEPHRVTRAYAQLAAYQQRHNVNPLRGFLVPLVQTPVFVSFFLALQQMAAVPVPGLKGGGVAWISDLSSPDPTYAMPLLTSATMWMVLEAGAESGVSSPHAGAVRAVLRVLPLVFLPMTVHFPSAIFVYWLTSNSFSLLQTLLLRLPAVRSALRIPAPPPTPPPDPSGSGPKEGFLQKMRNSLAEARATQNAERREWQRRNHLKMAAKGPLRQTFAQNPLAPPAAPVQPAVPKRPWKETLG